jgi:CheY-like chemotaxis protein
MAKRLAASIGRYPAAVARNLFLVEDELMFAQRLRAAAGRLRVPVQALGPTDARNRVWNHDDVVVVQATVRPEQQLELIDHLRGLQPAPVVIAVTGHLETDLRQRLKARGAILAAHSAMDRVLARALGISDARGDADLAQPHPPS